MPFTYECAGCGKPVITKMRKHSRVFCTRECYQQASIKHPDRECAGCGRMFNPRRGSRSGSRLGTPNRSYCTYECWTASVITKECHFCGSEFQAKAFGEHNYRFCSDECKRLGGRHASCERCGKSFPVQKPFKRRFCSEECRRPPVYITCRNCKRTVRVIPFYAENGRQFCTVACYRRFNGETRLEARIRCALDTLGVEFEQEYAVGKWSIDFANARHRIAIEADGDYWHSLTAERDARRDEHLTRAGWRVVRLGESEVNSTRDLGAFILDRLRAATGLDSADLASPAGGPARVLIDGHSRPAFHLNHVRVGHIRKSGPVEGQLPLWGDGAA